MFRVIMTACISFLVAWLPKPVKERKGLWNYNHSLVHILSGISESAFAIGVLLTSFLTSMDDFTGSVANRIVNMSQFGAMAERDISVTGMVGLFSFAIKPLSILCCILACEGLIRALSAGLVQENLGSFLLAIPYRLTLMIMHWIRRFRQRYAFGPERPDEIRPSECTSSGMLEILCSRQKPWHDRQTLEYANKFYLLHSMELVRKGELWAYCYRFCPMHPGEIIRGALVSYPSALRHTIGQTLPKLRSRKSSLCRDSDGAPRRKLKNESD